MAILVLVTSPFVEQQRAALASLAPDERIYTDPATAPPADIEALMAFRLAPGIVSRFPALRFIGCVGAGIDDILQMPDVPRHMPIVRPVDPLHGQRMAQYVALMALRLQRDLPRLEAQHRTASWERFAARRETDCAIGVMGCGSMGAPVVDVFVRLGFPVAVWTRGPHAIQGAESFSGAAGLAPFLARTKILVCTLPLTTATRALLCARNLQLLPRGAYVINVSRGAILCDSDLVAAVDSGHLDGAALDVFETEPLPAESPLWRHPKILCTPHVAAVPRAEIAAAQFLDNVHRARAGKPLVNVVDREREY